MPTGQDNRLDGYAVEPWRAETSGGGMPNSGSPAAVRADEIATAHMVAYDHPLKDDDRAYWEGQMLAAGSLYGLLSVMGSQRHSSASNSVSWLIPTQPDTEAGTSRRITWASPAAWIATTGRAVTGQDLTRAEVRSLLAQALSNNTGPLDIEYSLRARAGNNSVRSFGLVKSMLKALTYVGRLVFGRSFNPFCFRASLVQADLQMLDHDLLLRQIQEDVRLTQVRLVKLLAGLP